MLQGLRNAGKSWLGKTLVAVLFGLLIVSFAVWGIGDIFRGQVRNTVATVGTVEISAEAARTAYQAQIQQLSSRFRQVITPEQARLYGLDRQILSRLVTEATLDERARELGLSVSDALVARSVLEDPAFRGPSGQFDRDVFNRLLYANNLTEQRFVAEQRLVLARQQLATALTADMPVSLAVREAVQRYGAERRSADYIVLDAAAAGEIPAPTDEQLNAYFAENRASYRAPEYRAITALAISPATVAKPDAVSDADAQALYEQVRDSRFSTPERRTVQQIPFGSPEDAKAAADRVRAGETTFEAIAADRGVADGALTLGTLTKAELIDPAVAEAAFALAPDTVSEPVQGRFGSVLLRVTGVEPASVRPFAEVSADLKQELATQRANSAVEALHDEIEDMRASARPLAEIAKDKGLTVVQVPAVDAKGQDKSGTAIASLPSRDELVKAAFASDVGVDNQALRTPDGGYVWFDVTGIEPARDKELADVREAVAAAWTQNEIAQRLTQKGRELVERLDKGETLEAVAGDAGATVAQAGDLTRGQAAGVLTANAVTQIFATPVGKAGSAALDGTQRAVFRVTGAAAPPFLTTTPQAETLENRLRTEITEDLLGQYIAKLQQDMNVRVDEAAFRRAVGGEL